jgi:hypothetical protein
MGESAAGVMAYIRVIGLMFALAGCGALAQNPVSPPFPAEPPSGQVPPQSAPAQTSPTPSQQPSKAQQEQSAPSEIVIHSGKVSEKDRKEALADQKPVMKMPELSKEPMTKQTRMLVVRSLNAETVFARKALPLGQRGVVLKDGRLSPADRELGLLVATYGPAVKPGDRALITDVKIGDKSIIFELNGGPKKKKKWYQRIEVGGMGGSAPISRQDPNQENASGTTVELAFDRFVPEMTGNQVRELLSPVLDFNAKSAAEAFIETVPPKVKEAIKDHHVLVGMNKEMVQYAKGRPEKKIHEKDGAGKDYEEWMYGEPPQEVQFVRFNGDEVVQLKIMAVDGQKTVKTEKEVNIENGMTTLAKKATQEDETKKVARPPSLKRPGEGVDNDAPLKQAGAKTAPSSSTTHEDEQWGVPKTTPGAPADPNAPKPQDNGTSAPK